MMADYADFLNNHRVILAPMAGVGDAPMRSLCIEQGAQLSFTEMVSAKGLQYESAKTRDLLKLAPNERYVGVQLFGHEPATMADQARIVEQLLGDSLAVIDINMGCPARKIVSKGDGSALMLEPALASKVIEAVSQAVDSPVSVKFRRGFDEGEESAVEFAHMAEQSGAAAVCVHGRYSRQFYRGRAEWGVIARVKSAVDIPVIGNGDITCGQDALDMIAQTGCDAVMVGRASRGNPWIFAEVRAALEEAPSPSAPEPLQRIAMARRHAELLDSIGSHGMASMRKQAAWYFKGLKGAAEARRELNECSTLSQFNAVFDHLEDLQEGR